MKTGIIYDLKMMLHEADEPHYECPDRITKILGTNFIYQKNKSI
jgi:hypothetical protein